MAFDIHTKTGRDKITTHRREPYWGNPLGEGLTLGFRKSSETDGGTWVARVLKAEGGYRYEALGKVEDKAGNVPGITYDAAVKAARAFHKQVTGGIRTDEVQTVAEACAAYVTNRELVVRDEGKNAAAALGALSRHVIGYTDPKGKRPTIPAHTLAGHKLATLRTATLEEWRAGLVGKNGRALKDVSKNKILATLKAALNFAVRQEWVSADRATQWANVKDYAEVAPERREVYLSPAQRAALMVVMPAHARPFVRILCLLPIRPGAAALLRVRHLDKRERVLTIGDKKADDKKHGLRKIPLSKAAFDLLAAGCKGKAPDEFIFTDANGGEWHHDSWKELFRAARKAAQLDPHTVAYSLRHSTITDMLKAGVDGFTVAHIAGTSVKQLQDHYYHLLNKHGEMALENLAVLEMAA